MKMLDHWLSKDGAGQPLACLATTFTFDADFFAEDCLSRFLSISTRDPDGATGLDIAGMLEEEERLAETQVCVLVDRSCRPDARNLRWDLLPVRVPHGLLHAKVVVLIWERSMRVVIGSANLTRAGYRHQVELGMAIDVDDDCAVPKAVFEDLLRELRGILALAPGALDRAGPKQRAERILQRFESRLSSLNFKPSASQGLKFALAAGSRDSRPLDRLGDVWSGSPPQAVVAMSPFWDDTPDMAGAKEVLERLAKRAPAGARTRATFVVPVDTTAVGTIVRAPVQLRSVAGSRIQARVAGFAAQDDRRLHAKCIQYQSATWFAVMFGSSNITAKGLGLDRAPHRELNLWLGCRVDSPHAKKLATLIPVGEELDGGLEFEPASDDEDESAVADLPDGFEEALLMRRECIELSFRTDRLPESWTLGWTPPGQVRVHLLDATAWRGHGHPVRMEVSLPANLEVLPFLLDVDWTAAGESNRAGWIVNIGPEAVLPPPSELTGLSSDVLLAILASTRPLREAIENALRAKSTRKKPGGDELDPLKRFDDSGLLIQRVRRASAALWGIARRLSARCSSLDALEWRLAGTLGPEHVARKLADAASCDGALAGEAQFLIGELALTVHRVPWGTLIVDLPEQVVHRRIAQTLGVLKGIVDGLNTTRHPAIDTYTQNVFQEVGA